LSQKGAGNVHKGGEGEPKEARRGSYSETKGRGGLQKGGGKLVAQGDGSETSPKEQKKE